MHPAGAQSTQSRHAFTLIEVMMATLVTLVALVGLIAAVTMGSEMLDVSRKQTVAMQILRNEVEQVHLKNWATVSALPANASITINSAGTGLSAGGVTDQQKFALTNYTYSYAPPYAGGVNDDNTSLMSVAKDFSCSLVITTVRANLVRLTYTVTWTAGNQRKTYVRISSTYYGKTGLNLYYQK
jgi:Tfp pilus assembly protein PilE